LTSAVAAHHHAAFAHAADGALLSSLLTQPLGGLLAIGTAATCIAATCTAATGTGAFVRLVERWWTARLAWAAGAAVLGAWIFKMAAHRGVLG